MPILLEEDLDRLASHQRIPDITTENAYGNQTNAYAEVEADVPIRIEQPEKEALDRGPTDIVDWTAFVLAAIANPPKKTDRFVLSDRTLEVQKVEDLTDLDGTLDHYQLDCVEVQVG